MYMYVHTGDRREGEDSELNQPALCWPDRDIPGVPADKEELDWVWQTAAMLKEEMCVLGNELDDVTSDHRLNGGWCYGD